MMRPMVMSPSMWSPATPWIAWLRGRARANSERRATRRSRWVGRWTLPAVCAAVTLTAPGPTAHAAKVLLDVYGDPRIVEVRVNNVWRPGARRPLPHRGVGYETVLPGNVVGFTLSVNVRVDTKQRIYEFRCAPSPRAVAMIMLVAGTIPITASPLTVMSGSYVHPQGACRMTRSGTWEPEKGMTWDR